MMLQSREKSRLFFSGYYNKGMEKEQLLSIVLQCSTLQEYVECAARESSCPFWVMDIWYHLRAISHHPDTMNIYNQSVRNASLMDSLRRWEKFHIVTDETHSSPIRFFDDQLQKDVIIIDVPDHGSVVGRATFFPEHEISDSDIQLIADGLRIYLRNVQTSPVYDPYHQAFENLLADRDIEASVSLLSDPACNLRAPYQVCCISGQASDYLIGSVSYINDVDEKLLPVMFRNSLYFLSSTLHKSDLVKHEFSSMGVSLPFEELHMVFHYAMQAKYFAGHPGADLTDYLYSMLEEKTDPACLILPEVRVCIRYDDLYQTQYFATILNYFRNGESKQKTAQAMNLHLNTVKYRLAQIQKLFSINVNEEREELFLSCLLAEKVDRSRKSEG